MTFEEYGKAALSTAIYPQEQKIIYPALGLAGEAGEVAEKIKKKIRDGAYFPQDVAKEIGDVLWYCNALAHDIGYSLEEIAQMNLSKLASRKQRGVIKGSGDDR